MSMGGVSTRTRSYDLAAPGANTNILGTAITPREDGFFVVTVCLTTGSVFNVTTSDGTTTFTNGLNASAALNAGDVYTFTFGVIASLGYNFQVETNSAIRMLIVHEVTDAAVINSAQGA